MQTILKLLAILLLAVVFALLAGIIYLFTVLPKKESPQQITIQATPERLRRGEYLVRHVVMCTHCHSQRQTNFWALPPVPGTEGQGELFVKEKGLGEVYSPNITPHALQSWSDGEMIRAITAGVNKDGDPLFPIMPYHIYQHLKDEDLHAIIVYIRSLKPITHEVPRTKLEFPLNLIVRTIPGPAKADPKIQEDPSHYLAEVAGCLMCHTPTDDRGQPVSGMTAAGGQTFGSVRSANITPDLETGIGKWSKADFIAAFKKWDASEMRQISTAPDRNTVMPWTDYAGMAEEDLSKIYDYLRTLPPVKNRVEKFPSP